MRSLRLAIVFTVAACGGDDNNNTQQDAPVVDSPSNADCTTARKDLLGSSTTVSTGAIAILDTTAGVSTVYADASAGGTAWLFINLATNTKVEVNDPTSITSTDWDLAIKRPVIYTNDGDGGAGQGGAVLIQKDFATVVAADATSATFAKETFFDADCNPNTDPTGSALTTMSTWYSYNQATHILTPAAGTWLIKGGKGAVYKFKFDSYYANPDGSEGTGDGGTYKYEVGAL